MDLKKLKEDSMEIRKLYHALEERYHLEKWSIEEDALAFLTDAGIVGRLTMDNQKRWPSITQDDLSMKIGECVWWLAVLAERMNLDFENCVEKFIEEKMNDLK
ncbi:MAG: hypothetical protein MR601_08805 [Erysipelotrichaceae bacterium]|nr:hypothetical protein [Erysipelotrichaceae bacterium]